MREGTVYIQATRKIKHNKCGTESSRKDIKLPSDTEKNIGGIIESITRE